MNKTWTLKAKVDDQWVSIEGMKHEDAVKAIYRAMAGEPILAGIDRQAVTSDKSEQRVPVAA